MPIANPKSVKARRPMWQAIQVKKTMIKEVRAFGKRHVPELTYYQVLQMAWNHFKEAKK